MIIPFYNILQILQPMREHYCSDNTFLQYYNQWENITVVKIPFYTYYNQWDDITAVKIPFYKYYNQWENINAVKIPF